MKYMRFLILLLFIALLSVHLFILPPNLSPELLLKDEWIVNEQELPDYGLTPSQRWFPLFQDGSLIYLTPGGAAGETVFEDFYLEFDASGYISTSQYHRELIRRAPSGEFLEVIESAGFPIFLIEYLGLVHSDGLGIDVLSADRNVILSRRWASPLVTVSAATMQGDMLLAVGLLDGRYFLFDDGGELRYSNTASPDSRLPVLYGLNLFTVQDSVISDMSGGSQFLLATVAGFEDPYVEFHVLTLDVNGQLDVQNIARQVLPFQLYSPASISSYLDRQGQLEFSVSSAEGSVVIDIQPNMEQSQIRHVRPDLQNISTQGFSLFNGLSLRSGFGREISEIYLEVDRDFPLFHRILPAPSVIQIQDDQLVIRSGGWISSYILEEG